MKNLIFWSKWKKSEQILYVSLFSLFLISLVLYLFSYIIGAESVIQWQTQSNLQPYRFVVDSFEHFLFDFKFELDSYLMTQEFRATDIQINSSATYIFLALFTTSLVLLITVATYLSRTWYIVIMSLLILYVISLNFELMKIFGKEDRTFFFITLLAYLPISYYFHAFDEKCSILLRFLVFVLITVGLGTLIFQFSEVEKPFFFIANFGITVPLLLTATFILLNAHEIIHAILYLITDSANQSSTNTGTHFLVLSGIYLLNLIYAYMYNSGFVNLGIVYFDPLLLIILTGFLGIWSFKRREIQYKDLLDFAPNGAFLYLALGLTTFATLFYVFSTANDPLIQALENVILYSHIGFGISFLMYVVGNFFSYIRENKKVYKVIYDPHQFGFIWVIALGILIMAGFVFRGNYFTYRYTVSGYFNGLADTYIAQNDLFLGEQYYQTALGYDLRNHKSNYALASLARKQQDLATAYYYFEKALASKPSAFAYANAAYLLAENNRFFDAIFKLREGVKKFPKSGELYNNLGLLFNRTALADSAFYFLDKAKISANDPTVAQANLFAIFAKNKMDFSADSIEKMIVPDKNVTNLNNELVVRNKLHSVSKKPLEMQYLSDSILQTVQLCYLYNYTLNQFSQADTSILTTINKFEKVAGNIDFDAYFKVAKMMKLYGLNEHRQAYKELQNMFRNGNPMSGEYANLLGMYLFQLKQYKESAKYFRIASERGTTNAQTFQAIALSELPNKNEAIDLWIKISNSADSASKKLANDMLKLIQPESVKNLDISKFSDSEKYQYLHYNSVDSVTFNKVFSQIKDLNIRKKYELDQSFKLTNVPLSELKNRLKDQAFFRYQVGYQTLHKALDAEENKQNQSAEAYFALAVRQLPFEPLATLAFANFCNQQQKIELGYSVLNDALNVYEGENVPANLLQAYILQCADLEYDSYADYSLEQLKTLISVKDFEEFKAKYLEKRKAVLEKN